MTEYGTLKWQPRKTCHGIEQEFIIAELGQMQTYCCLKKKLKGLTQITMKENKYAHREDIQLSHVGIPALQKLLRHRFNKLR